MRNAPALLPLLLLLAAGCSAAAPANETASGAAGAADDEGTPPAGEQLIGQPPQGWQRIGGTNLETLKRAEFAPEEEIETDPKRRITFESMVEDPLPDPIEFVTALAGDRNRECGTFRAFTTFAGEENGYPTTVNLLVCHKDRKTGRSEVTLMKAIQGNDAFYVITRGRQGPPIPKDGQPEIEETVVGAWAVYLKSITLCDDERPGHPCPTRD
ncbi:MAG: hypothetical protein PVH91_09160 [Pseudomonadales bacterium]|jgi:hypothetical protein